MNINSKLIVIDVMNRQWKSEELIGVSIYKIKNIQVLFLEYK